MLMAVNSIGNASLYFVVSPDVAKAASTLMTSDGLDAFPAMSAQGGEMANLPAIVSATLPAGTIYLIDAAGLGGEAESIDVKLSGQATIEMADNPAQDASTATGQNLVSLFQTNSIGLMATCYFGIRRLRDDAVAVLTDVEWGVDAPVSGT